MPSQPHEAEVAHSEVCEAVESGLSKLQDWLDVRLKYQDELLQTLSQAHDFLSSKPSGCGNDEDRLQSSNHKERISNSFDTPRDYMFEVLTQLEEVEDVENYMPSSAVIPFEQHAVSAWAKAELPADLEVKSTNGSLEILQEVPSTAEPAVVAVLLPGCAPDTVANIAPTHADIQKEVRASVASQKKHGWQSKLMDVFDELDADGSGSIDKCEFADAFQEVGLPPVRAFEIFASVDKTENKAIDRIEWLHVIEEAARGSDDEIELLRNFLDRLEKLQKNKGHIFANPQKRKRSWIIRHDRPPRMAWDIMIMVLLLYVSLSLPYSLAFGDTNIIETLDRIFDMIFCVDVVLNLRTSFVDRDENIIVDGNTITCKYLKTWFLIDFMSSVPFELVTAGLMPNMTPARLLKIGKIAKVLKLLRISKMATAFAGSELMEKFEERSSSGASQTIGRLSKLVASAFVLAHWLACFGAAVDSSSLDDYFARRMESPNSMQKYIAAMYGAMTTLSTVGYGDIIPMSDAERAYAMFAMVLGGAFYGYIIGSVTSIVSDMDLNARAFYNRMDLIQAWLDSRDEIPKLFRRRVRKHFKLMISKKSAMDDSAVLVDLSPELKADISWFLIHDHVRCNPMFDGMPNGALANLVLLLQKNHASTNEFIVRAGDPGTAMHVLVDGAARYDEGHQWMPPTCDNPTIRFQKLTEGDSFGEEIIFQLEEDYMYSVVAMKPCEFHSISEDGFKHQYRNMPELHKQMFVNFLRSRTFAPHDGASRTGIMTCSSSVHSRGSPSMKPTR